EAISSPLLDNISIQGASGVLINITGGMDLAIDEVTTISTIIQEAAGEDAEIIFGAVHDSTIEAEVRVTVIATGMGQGPRGFASRPSRPVVRQSLPPTPTTRLPDPTDLSIPTFIRKQTRTPDPND